MTTYVVARNKDRRPTVVHKGNTSDLDLTGCGHDMTAWSRVYFTRTASTGPIIDVLLCQRPGCKS